MLARTSARLPCAPQSKVGPIAQKRGNLGKRGRQSRAQVAVRAYSVTFKMPEGEEKTIECDEDTYILDKADEEGIDLPYSCRAGSCSSCAAKIISGELDQSDQTFLDEAAIAKGFALICVSYPSSDLVLETHQEENIM